jgi:hypothetical protein
MNRRMPSPVRRRGRARLIPIVARFGRTQPKQQAARTIRKAVNDRSRRLLRPSGYVRDNLDFYVEDQQCVDSLLDEETDWPEPILDPACGSGNIIRACQARGLKVIGTDIVARGFAWKERDFLHDEPMVRPGAIICNPPYKMAVKFIKRALELNVPKFAMLVGDKFRYSQARWYELFRNHPPARVCVLTRRPSLPPGELYLAGKIHAKGGTKDYEWMVWDRAHSGPTIAIWLPPNSDGRDPKCKTGDDASHRRRADLADRKRKLSIPQLANRYMTEAERSADAIANYDEALRAMRYRNMRP